MPPPEALKQNKLVTVGPRGSLTPCLCSGDNSVVHCPVLLEHKMS